MPTPFSADEVYEMAEEIEQNGAKFYRGSAEKFPDLKELFLELASMEDEHLMTFKAMRSELSEGESQQPVFDPDGEAHLYLRAMADGHVFDVKSDPMERLGGVESPQDVIKAALQVEKDSVAFYAGLKEYVARQAGKEKVDAIIKEEFRHIGQLNQRLSEL